MVILGLPGLGNLELPILARRRRVTTERSIARPKYRDPKNGVPRLHSFSVHHRGVTLLPSSTRGAPMMTISSRAAATAFASLLLISSAFAQTTAPATPAPAEKKAAKPRTAASLECSKEADTKGVHGKERKAFMAECKKTAKDAAAK